MTAISQERLRSDLLAIMQDGRERTLGDLMRLVQATEGDIGQAMRWLLARGKIAVDYSERVAIYQIASKHRKVA